MAEMTPMMKQYLETKKEYNDCILFYRLGDFYEMFFEDAKIASRELDLTLTGKSCGLEERAPMCGIPYHAVDSYLNRLVKHGYKVAICEQLEDPKEAKGIVKRDVVRIVTPSTNIDMQALDEGKNNYLMSIVYSDKIGISLCDVTTGEFYVSELNDIKELYDDILRFNPVEIICNEGLMMSGFSFEDIKNRINAPLYRLDDRYFREDECDKILTEHFKASLTALGLTDFVVGKSACGGVLNYLYETQKNDLTHLTRIVPLKSGDYMLLDSYTIRNLELTETLREKQKRGTLLWVLDKTKTAMGARCLRQAVISPLINLNEIDKRLEAVNAFYRNPVTRDEIREYLTGVYDLERLLTRISYRSANPRDMLAFSKSLKMLSPMKTVLFDITDKSDLLKELNDDFDTLTDIFELIDASIDEDAPISLKDGGFIKEGFNEELDELKSAKVRGKQWLYDMEVTEREKTGIKNLKIGFNRVFGYYFEVTNSYKDQVPKEWIRKQTLTGSERYMNEELKELEDKILNAEEKANRLEASMFSDILDTVSMHMERIQNTAKIIAKIDMLSDLAYVAERNGYVLPEMNDKGLINIKGGRHPVVEQMIEHDGFVSNDTLLDNSKNLISIITGPNMAGKSTYMRQSALIVLMAQMGSFVPASKAQIGIVDRIFTRVGASDDLASGQSTFMVEMNEVANILRNATSKSLLILDEIGRGTSTYDGLSIAWAVIEHISNKRLLGAKTLFATHYHELTELEGRMNNVNNYCIAVKEQGDDIVFLRKIVKGGADRSYGIQVAKLAGVPDIVIDRAKEISETLQDNDVTDKLNLISTQDKEKSKKVRRYDEVDIMQFSLFDTLKDEDVLKELDEIDIQSLTPLDALNTLYRLQNMRKNRWQG
ncbi:MAG TPA: DNA mismatch repair protein MutS [Lachnospiraceae bacterium]|nr:DNA mismatch repair protein MutS [Lachnospiraceae bacterium]